MGNGKTDKGASVSQSEVARAWGVSRQMVHKWVKEGMPLTSLVDAQAWRSKRLAAHGTGNQAPGTLNDARERKLALECEMLELRLAVERTEYLPAASVEEAMTAAGSVFTSGLAALTNDLPGVLAGLDERAIQSVLVEQFARLVDNFKKQLNDDIDRTKRKARAAKIAESAGQGHEKPKAAAGARLGGGTRKSAAQRQGQKV